MCRGTSWGSPSADLGLHPSGSTGSGRRPWLALLQVPGQPARSRRRRHALRSVGPEAEDRGRGGRRVAGSHGV